MKTACFALAAMMFAMPVSAKDALIPLSEADGAQLNGKTVALPVHERPSFVAMTPGKATFALLGAAAMIAAGNKLVAQHHIEDPAQLLREQLSIALKESLGALPQPIDATATKATKPKELAALHPEADYVLDVRSAGWNYAYYPTKWATYWVGYSVQVQLIDTKTGRQVSNAACNANTNKHPNPPSGDALLADDAKLLKDVIAGLGWTCVQLLGKEQFKLAEDKIPATPVEFKDPLAAHATAGQTAPAAPEPAATPDASATQTPPGNG